MKTNSSDRCSKGCRLQSCPRGLADCALVGTLLLVGVLVGTPLTSWCIGRVGALLSTLFCALRVVHCNSIVHSSDRSTNFDQQLNLPQKLEQANLNIPIQAPDLGILDVTI